MKGHLELKQVQRQRNNYFLAGLLLVFMNLILGGLLVFTEIRNQKDDLIKLDDAKIVSKAHASLSLLHELGVIDLNDYLNYIDKLDTASMESIRNINFLLEAGLTEHRISLETATQDSLRTE